MRSKCRNPLFCAFPAQTHVALPKPSDTLHFVDNREKDLVESVMVDIAAVPAVSYTTRSSDSSLSYKFQRLRERLRAAIASGELAGRLPGERILARRFQVNAKTLSKALTDLASEGLVQRRVGQGTFVLGPSAQVPVATRWLIVSDPSAASSVLVTELLRLNPESRCIPAGEILRPSLLSQYTAVINCCPAMPDSFYHDLAIRGLPVLDTARASGTYSTHGVLLDRAQGAFNLGRDLLFAGHKRLATIDLRSSTTVFDALTWAVARYGSGATVHAASAEHLTDAIHQGVSAVVCDGVDTAADASQTLSDRRLLVTGTISVAAVGDLSERVCCSGYYLDPVRQAQAIAGVMQNLQPHRLSVIWLSGTFVDRGTMRPMAAPMPAAVPNRMAALLAS